MKANDVLKVRRLFEYQKSFLLKQGGIEKGTPLLTLTSAIDKS